jgi:pimeloyl-ACP methyl ester carboxylesterase
MRYYVRMRRIVLLLFTLLAHGFPLSGATFKSHDGTTLYYDVAGKGDPVLLLSGGPGFSPDYLRPIAEKLGDGHRFILLHQRGTGKSVVATYDANALSLKNLVGDVEALRKELKVDKLVIAGHSFGGILSMMYAREYPERIAALALIDSGGPTLKNIPKFNANLEARFSDEDRALIKEWSDPERQKANRHAAALALTKAKAPAYFADRAKAKLLTDPMDDTSFQEGMFWSVVPQMMTLDLRGEGEGPRARAARQAGPARERGGSARDVSGLAPRVDRERGALPVAGAAGGVLWRTRRLSARTFRLPLKKSQSRKVSKSQRGWQGRSWRLCDF